MVGWIGYSKAVGREVFMPRCHEDIDSDRCAPGWAAFCYRVASLLTRSARSADVLVHPDNNKRCAVQLLSCAHGSLRLSAPWYNFQPVSHAVTSQGWLSWAEPAGPPIAAPRPLAPPSPPKRAASLFVDSHGRRNGSADRVR